jgi:hypothetical protein
MLLNFSNGIVQRQPVTPFLIKNGTSISLNSATAPLILSFSHGSSNYLTIHPDIIKSAWKGPFNKNKDAYLYVDININTAKITYGSTPLPPKAGGKLPIHAEIDQNFFEFKSRKMYIKRAGVNSWKEVIRVFVGEYRKGAILKCYDIGSNFNLATKNNSGLILFDENRHPIKKDNSNEFLTTESELTVENGYIGKIDQHLNITKCLEAIPKHHCVSIDTKNYKYCKLAKNGLACTGINQNGHASGDVVNYVKYGYLYDVLGWGFSGSPGSPLYLGEQANISESPSRYIIQRVGFIIDEFTIFVDISDPIKTMFDFQMSPSVTPTSTNISATVTPTVTPSVTPTVTPTVTPSVTPTVTPSASPSVTATVTPSASPSVTATVTPSASPSVTATVTPSASPSVTATVTLSISPTITPTVTPSPIPSESIVEVIVFYSFGTLINMIVLDDPCSYTPREDLGYANITSGTVYTYTGNNGCDFNYYNDCGVIVDVDNGTEVLSNTYPITPMSIPFSGALPEFDTSNIPIGAQSEIEFSGGCIAILNIETGIGNFIWKIVYSSCS